MKPVFLLFPVIFCASSICVMAVELNPLFQNHAVLQCDAKVPVWGTGRDGEKITVEFGGQKVSTSVTDGTWKVWLAPMEANARPQTLSVRGDNTLEVSDVLVGEVWIASGQSNMERQLGLCPGQQPIVDWENEAAAAKYPLIREFSVAKHMAFTPQSEVKGQWAVCSPESVEKFSAVGYFFARDLFLARKVPVGIVHSSWGGTPAEAWTSPDGLQALPEYVEPLEQLKKISIDLDAAQKDAREKQEEWYRQKDPGSAPEAPWFAEELDTVNWKECRLPASLESVADSDFDGVFWFRRDFELPQDWDGGDVELRLGPIDDNDTTWVNGKRVGFTNSWLVRRVYKVPGKLLKPGKNTAAVRVLDTLASGGFYSDDPMRVIANSGAISIPIDGVWSCKPGATLKAAGSPPVDFTESPYSPTVLYNGMIAPLLPYAIRGAIWYQGESNVGRERQYRTLFPAMIGDWRRAWGQGDFPFLFVQIAPHQDMTPEIREAQLLTTEQTKNTAMAVTIDCGDEKDIHPTNKKPVGARLALAARALAYGEAIEFSGPVFEKFKVEGRKASLHFKHVGSGLVAKGGELIGFTIAGDNKVFHRAEAKITGDAVVVSSPEVERPVAVRYAWANVPEGNLFNRDGLPASPFRTDVD